MGPRWTFLIAFALVFYGTGAAVIESFVNYASWHLIGADEFIAYHQFISPRVLTFLVAPLLLGTAFTILMLWSRPAAIPAWAVWTAIAAQAVVWVSTSRAIGRTYRAPDRDQLLATQDSVCDLCGVVSLDGRASHWCQW